MSPNLSIYALSGKAKTTEFQSKLNSLESERKETKETTLVLKYNQAVILFHQQQFQKSIDILNELKKKIREEPVRALFNMQDSKLFFSPKLMNLNSKSWL